MLISAYIVTRLRALVYIARNVKEYKSRHVRDKDNNKDKNKENSKNDKIDNNKDKDKDNVKNNKMNINKDKDKDNVKNDKINNKEDSNKDNIKNNEINNKIVKAFLGHLDNMEPVKTLCYKDINFLFLSNPTRTRNLLALEINL